MSAATQVAAAVKSLVDGLQLGKTATLRKRLMLLDKETPPAILFAVGEGAAFEPVYAGAWLVRYPVSIALGFAAGGKVTTNATARTWTDAIWPRITDARNLRAAGLTSVNDVLPGAMTIFDAGPLGQAQVDWSVLNFQVETLEARY